MKNRNVLISGAGIAGPTLAYWLLRWGFQPILLERAPAVRTGGYMIDFWGLGWEVAERMHLIPQLLRDGYQMEEVRLVNEAGVRVAKLDGRAYRSASGGRFTSVLRSDLARNIYSLVDGNVETIFGDSIRSLQQDQDSVDVTFARSAPRRFDLVIGADGLHSGVRAAVFGDESRFEQYLGYQAASFSAAGYEHRDEDCIYVSYCAPGRQAARYSLRGDHTAFFFVFADPERRSDSHGSTRQAILRRVYGDAGWECPAILEAMESTDDLYFDAVSQIHMEQWWSGRVALVGDACFCPSLLAGQGSAFAMAGAYTLAAELAAADGEHVSAFSRYEARLRPFIEKKQRGVKWLGSWFAPKTRFGIRVRNWSTNLMNAPWLSTQMTRRFFADEFELPDGTGRCLRDGCPAP